MNTSDGEVQELPAPASCRESGASRALAVRRRPRRARRPRRRRVGGLVRCLARGAPRRRAPPPAPPATQRRARSGAAASRAHLAAQDLARRLRRRPATLGLQLLALGLDGVRSAARAPRPASSGRPAFASASSVCSRVCASARATARSPAPDPARLGQRRVGARQPLLRRRPPAARPPRGSPRRARPARCARAGTASRGTAPARPAASRKIPSCTKTVWSTSMSCGSCDCGAAVQ